MWTFSSIKDKVRILVGRQTITQLSEDRLETAINNYYTLVFPVETQPQELGGWWIQNTAANVESIAIDQSYIALSKPFMVAGDIDGVNVFTDPVRFYHKWPLSQEFSHTKPHDILLVVPTLTLRPIPDAVYEIRAWSIKRPDAFVNPSDEPLNQEWGEVIAYGAAIDIKQDNEEDISGLIGMYDYLRLKVKEKGLIQLTGVRVKPRF